MKLLFAAFFGGLLALAGTVAAQAQVPTAGNAFEVMIFVEVAPTATAEAAAAFRQYRDASRKEPGIVRAEVYQEQNVPSRFVTHDVWKDQASYEAHAKSASVATLFAKVKRIEFGPPDVHTHVAWYSAPEGKTPGNGAVLIVSHMDVTPNFLQKLYDAMKPLSEGTAKEPGVIRYEILQQAPDHNNHFRLYEVWDNEKDWQAHNLAAHTRQFREDLAPMLGTPYDQRKYAVMN
jgi:quinol monooxygenase YgiN